MDGACLFKSKVLCHFRIAHATCKCHAAFRKPFFAVEVFTMLFQTVSGQFAGQFFGNKSINIPQSLDDWGCLREVVGGILGFFCWGVLEVFGRYFGRFSRSKHTGKL